MALIPYRPLPGMLAIRLVAVGLLAVRVLDVYVFHPFALAGVNSLLSLEVSDCVSHGSSLADDELVGTTGTLVEDLFLPSYLDLHSHS